MASAPVIPFSTQTYRQPAQPAVRIAFIAGEAEQAISAATADLPAAIHTATLDDLNTDAGAAEISQQTHAFIELARGLLSPAMFPAFLRWGETAAHFATAYSEEEEGDRRFAAAADALNAVHATPAMSPHDFTFKIHLIELDDHPRVGELGPIGKDGLCLRGSDPVPLLEAMEKLAERAFELSASIDLSEPVGDAIRQAFLDATVVDHDATHRELLIQRNAIMERLNGPVEHTDAETSIACGDINVIESAVINRPARSADDAVMKLIAVAQVGAEGGQITDEHAIAAIADARRFFGVGCLPAEYMPQDLTPASISLPVGYAPYMRGPFIAWQRRYEDHARAHGARLSFELAVYSPLGSDVDDATQAKYDDLVDVEGDALERLLLSVAPSPAELAVKMKLLSDGEQWRFNQREGIVEAITADARRFGRHGAYLEGDQALLSSFSALRSVWTERGRMVDTSEAEDEAFYADLDRHEGVIAANDATTLEGVVAKLRVAFLHMVGEDWSDLTLVDPNARDFREGIASADPFQKLLWSATADLARIAGVNMSEQVA